MTHKATISGVITPRHPCLFFGIGYGSKGSPKRLEFGVAILSRYGIWCAVGSAMWHRFVSISLNIDHDRSILVKLYVTYIMCDYIRVYSIYIYTYT